MDESPPACPSFEVGPIRPPNEATSLLVRVTRNCPWNRCTFCPVYKGRRFSLRSPEEVEADIAAMAELAGRLTEASRRLGAGGRITASALREAAGLRPPSGAVQVALFLDSGGRSAFLQDANSLVLPTERLVRVLEALRAAFPSLERVTSYARAHTLTKRSVEELTALREAGLDRVHVGLESGSDLVLERVAKGAGAARHIDAGRRVKAAGLELSEYVMPGLGGRALSEEHARETARVLAAVEPHFVRLRTLAIPPGSPLAEQERDGTFEPLDDLGVAREVRSLLAGLADTTTTVRSDHVLNLLEEVEGSLPEDLPRLLGVIDRLLGLPEDEQEVFVVGRRLGLMRRLADLDDPAARDRAAAVRDELRRWRPGPLHEVLAEVMRGFV